MSGPGIGINSFYQSQHNKFHHITGVKAAPETSWLNFRNEQLLNYKVSYSSACVNWFCLYWLTGFHCSFNLFSEAPVTWCAIAEQSACSARPVGLVYYKKVTSSIVIVHGAYYYTTNLHCCLRYAALPYCVICEENWNLSMFVLWVVTRRMSL
jgi:hypothetical protein